ncbi:MAG: DUF4325 domain-containing protein [Ruminococcus sp.]|nr:DUF4325 domain-containing protein [Ruminococcus sp.]
MKLSGDKKQEIIIYICDKISNHSRGVTKSTAEAFGISQNTANTYLTKLQDDGIIRKLKRDSFELVKQTHDFVLYREKGQLDDDMYAYENFIFQFIKSLPEHIISIWEYAVSEMCNNVMDHSEAESLLVSVEQDYLNTRIFLVDDGVGIFEKIKNHFSYNSIDDAKYELFKGKLTTDEINHTGEGIFFTSKLMDRFAIYSSGTIFSTNKFDKSEYTNIDLDMKGTCVLMELSNRTNKVIRDIFEIYSDVDDGFTKTKVPLRQFFDKSPVSRSQAKRVCSRLECFKEVELDFDGLEWMGQGFAHQLFVVFSQNHPDIKLSPINMCDEIIRMYKHVISGK